MEVHKLLLVSDVTSRENTGICVIEMIPSGSSVNALVESSRKTEFQHLLTYQLPAFVVSFGSNWRFQTFRGVCAREVL
jgi:hypothetical protein